MQNISLSSIDSTVEMRDLCQHESIAPPEPLSPTPSSHLPTPHSLFLDFEFSIYFDLQPKACYSPTTSTAKPTLYIIHVINMAPKKDTTEIARVGNSEMDDPFQKVIERQHGVSFFPILVSAPELIKHCMIGSRRASGMPDVYKNSRACGFCR